MAEIFLGEPPANIKQFIIQKYGGGGGSSGHADTIFTFSGGQIVSLNISGELGDSIWSIDNLIYDGSDTLSRYDLVAVDIGNIVTSIGETAFYNCRGLTGMMIPNSVTSIGTDAFYSCSGLTSVTIPNSVTSIGTDAFFECTSVTDVYCYPNPANMTWNDGDCDDFRDDSSTICHVKSEYLSAYQSKFSGQVNVTFVGDLT